MNSVCLGLPRSAWDLLARLSIERRAATDKARSPYLVRLVRGTARRFCLEERKLRTVVRLAVGLSGGRGLFLVPEHRKSIPDHHSYKKPFSCRRPVYTVPCAKTGTLLMDKVTTWDFPPGKHYTPELLSTTRAATSTAAQLSILRPQQINTGHSPWVRRIPTFAPFYF